VIHADLAGKTHIAEDVLTSNCLGLLRLLPDSSFISFLEAAVTLDGKLIDLSIYKRVERIEFWRWLPEGGEPDVTAEFQSEDGSARMTVVIEVKHGAGKSGGSPSSEAVTDGLNEFDNTEVVERERSSDQLTKYWRAANKCFPQPSLIYLTHHRSLPKDDMAASLREAGSDAKIFWLSWFHLYRWVIERIAKASACPTSERRILETLRHYLEEKGYKCFLGWSSSTETRSCRFAHSHACYARTYRIDRAGVPRKLQSISYAHRYEINQTSIPAMSLGFYQTSGEE